MAAFDAFLLFLAGQSVAGVSEEKVLEELRANEDPTGTQDMLTSYNLCDVGDGEIPKACAVALVALAQGACSEGMMISGAIALMGFASAGCFPIRASCADAYNP